LRPPKRSRTPNKEIRSSRQVAHPDVLVEPDAIRSAPGFDDRSGGSRFEDIVRIGQDDLVRVLHDEIGARLAAVEEDLSIVIDDSLADIGIIHHVHVVDEVGGTLRQPHVDRQLRLQGNGIDFESIGLVRELNGFDANQHVPASACT
jgi:hypothetical protein